MSAPQYLYTLPADLPDRLVMADQIHEATETPGWKNVLDAIDAHKAKVLQRLLHETTKPEQIPYLRGLVAGLESMREAADAIMANAAEAEAEAKRRTAQELTHA